MSERIFQFIQSQTCASVCCIDEMGKPYCFSCFYTFNSHEILLYYKSSMDTRHARLLKINPILAGTILPDQLNFLQIKGIQFEGELLTEDHPLTKKAALNYYKKNPAALAMPGEIWTIQLNVIKMTDNTLGFGTKLNWDRRNE